MKLRFIDSEKVVAKLQSREQPPPLIVQHRERIEGEIRVLELRCSLENREATEQEIRAIVELKLQLDDLYGSWIEGTL